MSESISRQDLFDAVWATPLLRLSRQFKLDDEQLAKTCHLHGIPLPRAGYWETPEADRPTLKPALRTYPGMVEGVILTRQTSRQGSPLSIFDTFFDPELGRLAEMEDEAEWQITVRERLTNPHPLTSAAATQLRNDTYFDSRYQWVSSWSDHAPAANISVSKSNVGRALRIMDALVKAMEKRGYGFVTAKENWQRHQVLAFDKYGNHFRVFLREATQRKTVRQSQRSWSESVYVPTGRLYIDLCSSWHSDAFYTVKDGVKARIENMLNRLPVAILRYVDTERRRSAERWVEGALERQEKQRREQEQARLLAQRELEEEEQERREQLFQDAETWHRCRLLREYIAAVRTLVIERRGNIEPESNAANWLEWAEAAANEADPLVTIFGKQ